MDDRRRDPAPNAQPPDDSANVVVVPASRAAGGASALAATLRYASAQTGLVRGARILVRTNQAAGFDCPGCAWPEPEHRDAVEFCENGAKAVLSEATTRRVDRAFFAQHTVADLAERSDAWLNDQGRLVEPMVLHEGATHYEPIDWEDAFSLLARELRALPSPDEAIFYTSGRTSNEAAFLYQLFVRAFGTNNLPDCSNMCHESSGTGLKESIGVGKGTVQLEDFEIADAIFVVGQNPGTNHPRMLTTLEAAAKRGATIVSVNPLAEIGTMRFAHPQSPLGLLGEATHARADARPGTHQRRRGVLPGRHEGDARGGGAHAGPRRRSRVRRRAHGRIRRAGGYPPLATVEDRSRTRAASPRTPCARPRASRSSHARRS